MKKGAKLSLLVGMGLGSLALVYIFVAIWMQPGTSAGEETREEERLLFNCCIVEAKEAHIRFLYENQAHTLALSDSYSAYAKELETLSWQLADLRIEGDTVTQIRVKQETLVADAFRFEDDGIAIGETSYALAEDFRAYDRDKQECIAAKQLIAYAQVRFLLQDGKVVGAIAGDSQVPNIRVALMDAGFLSHEHASVTVSADTPITVTCYLAKSGEDEEKRTTAAGEKLSFQSSDAETYSRVLLATDGGALRVESLTRNGWTPEYAGTIELIFMPEGIWIVNELPLEDYLCGVLPSEVPSTFSMEAMKAQAICARSYAFAALSSPKYPAVLAHVDDSTNSQVYNNTPSNDAARQAVAQTTGQMLWRGDRLAATYYYSTSCGVGASVDEVWSEAASDYLVTSLHANFREPSEMVAKLLSAMSKEEQAELIRRVDFSNEQAFRTFLQEEVVTISLDRLTIQEEMSPYETDFLWYRWSAEVSLLTFSETVNRNLELYAKTYEKVLTITDLEGKEKESPAIGEIASISVTKRGKSGIATEVVITGSEGIATLTKQTAIRTILSLQGEEIVRRDGKAVSGPRLLPSAFFYVECKDGIAAFFGGGYGHGVGMSQNGANEMAKEGRSCEEILAHFFPGTQLVCEYESEED